LKYLDDSNITGYHLVYYSATDIIVDESISLRYITSEVAEWLEENVRFWAIQGAFRCLLFTSKDDAMLFKLTWS